MSSTRKRANGESPAQQGYSSSAQHERGLLANLVALRCDAVDSAADRELLFTLQHVSHQPGGLAKFAETLIAAYPEQIATTAMQRFGFKPGQLYRAEQVREVRAEIPGGADRYLLKGELREFDPVRIEPDMMEVEDLDTGRTRLECNPRVLSAKAEAQKHPATYEAAEFVRICQETAREHLAARLERVCLDPAAAIESRWYFPNLTATLRQHFQKGAEAVRARLAETAITRQVFEALDYSLAGDGITLIEGLARTGKTFAIKAWCDQRPGLARYVQVPPTNDDISFFRRIAEAFGVSSGLSMKGIQLRERVERTARAAKLTIVFDEGHYLLSQDYRCRKRPSRIAWVMNELINYGVPVAICTTPQFIADKARVQERTGWAWEQFDGRIGHLAALDQILSLDDLKAVARIHLPEASADAILGAAMYAQKSTSYVAGIEHVAKRARYCAQRAGRMKVSTEDVVEAIKARLPLDLNSRASAAKPESKRPASRVSKVLGRAMSPDQSELPACERATELQVI
jgi:hypothetical protein